LIAALTVAGCAHQADVVNGDIGVADANGGEAIVQVQHSGWGPTVTPDMPKGPRIVAESDGPYQLDTGDRLRVFVYGQPNLSRVYPVDHEGRISVPLIGQVKVRGSTTAMVEATIKSRLGAQFVKDPQVTVDIAQNRPIYVLGEVRNAGAYPYASGMIVLNAVATAGGYSERANERQVMITRRVNGVIEKIEAPHDYVVMPGDTIYVTERWF
jgi:polysaccharide export outer membrane protein